MTFVSLNPSSTSSNTGAVTGSSAHAALSDGSDATYVDYDYGEGSIFGLSDLSLPSGAVIMSAQVVFRCRKDGTGPGSVLTVLNADAVSQSSAAVTWELPAETGGLPVWGGSDAGLDAAVMGLSCQSLSAVRVYEAFVRVLYLTKPTVTVSNPTGTITTNTTAVVWTPVFDSHAQSGQHFRDVKIFSQAQYSAGGFDPSTSTPTVASGVRLAAPWAENFSGTALADGNYRAYVRVAASNVPDQWSDWAYSAFTVDVDKPGVPSIAATPEHSAGRVKLDLDDSAGDTATTTFQVERSVDGGASWQTVRTPIVSIGMGGWVFPDGSGNATLYDYEAPNGVTVRYRARAYSYNLVTFSAWSSSVTTAWSSSDEWLKCVLDPTLNLKLTFKSYSGFEVPANQGVFRPLGSEVAVVTQDVPGPEQGTIIVFSKSQSDRVALSALTAAASPVLMQVPGHPDRLVMLGDRSSSRVVDNAGELWHEESFPWTVVANP